MYGRRHEPPSCTASTLPFRSDGRVWRCICVFAFLLILADGMFTDGPEPLVETQWGFLRGKLTRSIAGLIGAMDQRDRPVANFLGIPYALPPLDDLRFKSPQRWNRTWTTIRNAMIDGQNCTQLNGNLEVVGSEDCLYLNIFVPYISENQQKSMKLPVLVFVHGGGYKSGSSDSKIFAPDYLMKEDVIVVTLNYRLNILGFFSTTSQVSPGNYGLKDIKMAFEWIQENIHSFGGNPESVTAMGVSAGAAAIHILSLTNKTDGLFHKYILHSGSALNPWALQPKRVYRQICLKLAKMLDCLPERYDDTIASNETVTETPEEKNEMSNIYDNVPCEDCDVKNDEEMMKCIKMVNVTKLVKMTAYFIVWGQSPLVVFSPTLEDDSEDAILTMHPMKIMKNGQFRDIPAIFQVTRDEGLVKTFDFFSNSTMEKEMIEKFEEYLPFLMECQQVVSNTSVFASAIKDFYFNGNVTLGLTYNITKATSDIIISPILQAVKYHSKIGNSSIYFSLFAYEGTFSNTFASGRANHYGVCHGDDINYFFPELNNIYQYQVLHNTENDITMINIMTEIWANFATEGVPRTWLIPAWPTYRDHHQFMRFGNGKSPVIGVEADFLPDRMEFWWKLMPTVTAGSVDIFVGDPPVNDNANTYSYRLILLYLILLLIAFLYV